MYERYTLSESGFDAAFVLREDGEALLPIYDRREALFALELVRSGQLQQPIRCADIEAAIRVAFA